MLVFSLVSPVGVLVGTTAEGSVAASRGKQMALALRVIGGEALIVTVHSARFRRVPSTSVG